MNEQREGLRTALPSLVAEEVPQIPRLQLRYSLGTPVLHVLDIPGWGKFSRFASLSRAQRDGNVDDV